MSRGLGPRAQLELIGLVVIVIIVISAMLIYMVYKVNNPERSVKRAFVNEELAANYLITSLKVTVKECPQHSLSDLMTDCAKDYRDIMCAGQDSCVLANATLAKLMDSITSLGKNYSFSIKKGDEVQVFSSGCKNMNRVSATQDFTVYPSMQRVSLVLDVCDSG